MNNTAMKSIPLWIALALPLVGCQTTASQISSSGKMGPDDASFVSAAYRIAQLDERAGQLAAKKATDPRVQNIAATMSSEAQVLYPNLQGALQAEHQPVPTGAPQDIQAELQKMAGLSGPAFDHEFVADEIAAHKQAVDMLKKEDASTKNAALKTQVETELPAVLGNLNALNAIANPAS